MWYAIQIFVIWDPVLSIQHDCVQVCLLTETRHCHLPQCQPGFPYPRTRCRRELAPQIILCTPPSKNIHSTETAQNRWVCCQCTSFDFWWCMARHVLRQTNPWCRLTAEIEVGLRAVGIVLVLSLVILWSWQIKHDILVWQFDHSVPCNWLNSKQPDSFGLHLSILRTTTYRPCSTRVTHTKHDRNMISHRVHSLHCRIYTSAASAEKTQRLCSSKHLLEELGHLALGVPILRGPWLRRLRSPWHIHSFSVLTDERDTLNFELKHFLISIV